VFERRFHDQPICDAEHLRNAIVYTHLNPVRAGLCAKPEDSTWTSHAAYTAVIDAGSANRGSTRLIAAETALPLFASGESRTALQLRSDYEAYVQWRVETDRALANEERRMLPTPPSSVWGDRHWMRYFSAPFRNGYSAKTVERSAGLSSRAPDLRDIALAVLAELKPEISIDELRDGTRSRRAAYLRRIMITRMIDAGYRGVQIANYLRIDLSCVSRVHTARRALARTNPAFFAASDSSFGHSPSCNAGPAV
jgi:hypothetical protein